MHYQELLLDATKLVVPATRARLIRRPHCLASSGFPTRTIQARCRASRSELGGSHACASLTTPSHAEQPQASNAAARRGDAPSGAAARTEAAQATGMQEGAGGGVVTRTAYTSTECPEQARRAGAHISLSSFSNCWRRRRASSTSASSSSCAQHTTQVVHITQHESATLTFIAVSGHTSSLCFASPCRAGTGHRAARALNRDPQGRYGTPNTMWHSIHNPANVLLSSMDEEGSAFHAAGDTQVVQRSRCAEGELQQVQHASGAGSATILVEGPEQGTGGSQPSRCPS